MPLSVSYEFRQLRQAHAGQDDGDPEPLDHAEGLTEHNHGDKEAGGELSGGHDGGKPGGQMR